MSNGTNHQPPYSNGNIPCLILREFQPLLDKFLVLRFRNLPIDPPVKIALVLAHAEVKRYRAILVLADDVFISLLVGLEGDCTDDCGRRKS